MMLRPWLAVALLWAPLAGAQTVYSWIDEAGTVHFTDSLAGVPQGAKIRTTEGAELAVVDTGKAAATAPQAQDASAPAPARGPPAERSALTGEVLDEAHWRNAFKTLNRRTRELEDEIAVDEKLLKSTDGVPINMQCGAVGWGNDLPPLAPPVAAGSVSVEGSPVPGVTVTGAADFNGGVAAHPRGQRRHPGGHPGGLHRGTCWVNANPELERVRERLERNKAALARAREDLGDLERLASHHGVPREWRR